MKSYKVDGYTFTEKQLKGQNPYANSDGTPKQDAAFAFWAFVEAQANYELDHLSPEEKETVIARRRHIADKMNSSVL